VAASENLSRRARRQLGGPAPPLPRSDRVGQIQDGSAAVSADPPGPARALVSRAGARRDAPRRRNDASPDVKTSADPSDGIDHDLLAGLNRPSMSARASGFSTSRWMVRLSGRAPKVGSVPSRAINARAAGVSSSVRSWSRGDAGGPAISSSDDRGEVSLGEGVEHDDLVDPVQELRAGTAGAGAR
jgi:hypothetical protein